MNLKQILKDKIINEVLENNDANWSVFVYDSIVGQMFSDIFTKSDLVNFSISTVYHINENKIFSNSLTNDSPVIYFVTDTEDNFTIILNEFKKKIFNKYLVVIADNGNEDFSYFSQKNLFFKVKYFNCNIKVIEERIFTLNKDCNDKEESYNYENIQFYMENLFNIGLNVFTMGNLFEKYTFADSKKSPIENLIVLDRSFDFFTPLIHFYSFRSILYEIGVFFENKPVKRKANTSTKSEEKSSSKNNVVKEKDDLDNKDPLWDDLKNVHMAEVNEVLKYNINKISENVESLDKKLTTEELSKMVLDAPENIKIKNAIQKYSNLLKNCFYKLESLQSTQSYNTSNGTESIFKNLTEAELILATHRSKGKVVKQIELAQIFNILKNSNITKEEKLRLFYEIKLNGLKFTTTEKQILQQLGFSMTDIELNVDTSSQYKRKKFEQKSKYEISRFEPFLYDLIKDLVVNKDYSFVIKTNNKNSEDINTNKKVVYSLRKAKMISNTSPTNSNEINLKNKKILIIFIIGGLTTEECRLAYELSDLYGVSIILGSDKILKPGEILKYIKNKNE